MEIRIKKLFTDAKLPTKAHNTDAGYDLYAYSMMRDNYGDFWYTTGIAMEIPKGYVGLVFPRSSIYQKDMMLTNSVGVIDSGYRGDIQFKFKQVPFIGQDEHFLENEYKKGDRIGQLIIIPYPEIEFKEVDELSDTDRGAGGFGSSGR